MCSNDIIILSLWIEWLQIVCDTWSNPWYCAGRTWCYTICVCGVQEQTFQNRLPLWKRIGYLFFFGNPQWFTLKIWRMHLIDVLSFWTYRTVRLMERAVFRKIFRILSIEQQFKSWNDQMWCQFSSKVIYFTRAELVDFVDEVCACARMSLSVWLHFILYFLFFIASMNWIRLWAVAERKLISNKVMENNGISNLWWLCLHFKCPVCGLRTSTQTYTLIRLVQRIKH